ncbi:hypothetical protein B224_2713 [Aeromonas media WS]|nr:hypothetical protein B224_2713 [Aeromonas media WS]
MGKGESKAMLGANSGLGVFLGVKSKKSLRYLYFVFKSMAYAYH